MDVVPISVAGIEAQKSAALSTQVSYAVERKSLDILAQEGEALARMMAASAGVGGAVDTKA
jgi:hypothetical protein